jgi:hypothetical protein
MNRRPLLSLAIALFGLLFSLPENGSVHAQWLGPEAVSAALFQRPSAASYAVSVSRQTGGQMDLHLREIESAERNQRLTTAAMWLGAGAYFGLIGASYFAFGGKLEDLSRRDANRTGGVMTGLSALFILYGSYTLLRPWGAERMVTDYRAAVSQGEYGQAAAVIHDRLPDLLAAETRDRWIRGIIGGLTAGVSAVTWAFGEIKAKSASERMELRLGAAAGTVVGLLAVADSLLVESPTERLLNVLQGESERLQLVPGVALTSRGATLGINGRF